MLSIWSCILLLLANQACANTTYKYGSFDYSEYDRPGPIDNDVKGMVKQMTLQEKIGQMTQLNEDLILNKDGTLNKTAVEHYASNYYIGSYLNQLAR
jgi:beta-glucosidase